MKAEPKKISSFTVVKHVEVWMCPICHQEMYFQHHADMELLRLAKEDRDSFLEAQWAPFRKELFEEMQKHQFEGCPQERNEREIDG